MGNYRRPQSDEVTELLRNAELRDELEPYYDESISRVNVQSLPIRVENEFLASMLAWERAPILPIYRHPRPTSAREVTRSPLMSVPNSTESPAST